MSAPFPAPRLADRFGRRIDYLRLSITDRCNLRCVYCMPPGHVEKLSKREVLTLEEYVEVTRVAASLGVAKVRITGGEPLLRKGAVKLVRDIAALPGVRTVAMTTNGTRLGKYAQVLRGAGLTRLNVSLDSLDPEIYRQVTGGGDLSAVLAGIDAALAERFPVKINSVLIGPSTPMAAERFVRFAIDKGVEVRFIEQMSLDDPGSPYLPADQVIAWIGGRHRITALPADPGSPHVKRFDCDGARIGFISPRSRPFCDRCNKLRLIPGGQLRACLAATAHVDMRPVLRRPHTDRDVILAIEKAASLKPEAGPWTAESEMWRVGG